MSQTSGYCLESRRRRRLGRRLALAAANGCERTIAISFFGPFYGVADTYAIVQWHFGGIVGCRKVDDGEQEEEACTEARHVRHGAPMDLVYGIYRCKKNNVVP